MQIMRFLKLIMQKKGLEKNNSFTNVQQTQDIQVDQLKANIKQSNMCKQS